MSASRERKKRTEQVSQPETKKKTKKLSEGWIFAICMIAIVVILVGALIGYSLYMNSRPVLTVGDHTVTVSEFNYFYTTKVNNCSSYASYMGIDSSTPLDEQYVTESGASMLMLIGVDSSFLSDKTATDGTYNVTWAQLFADAAKTDAASAYAVYNEAMANGYEISEHIEEDIEENVEQMKTYAENNSMSLSKFIERVYGKGCNESGYRDYLKVQFVASDYASTLTYSAEEIEAKRAESPEDYAVATYYQYSVSASEFVEEGEDGEKPDPTAAEEKQAKDAAEAMAADFDVEKATIKADTARATATASATEEAANWLFDTAENNDVKLFEKEGTYYVLKLIDKTDYMTGNYLQIVLAADGEELEEGELTAAEKKEKIVAALEADASAENFEALAEEYSGSHEIEAENTMRSALSSISDEALFWSMGTQTAGEYQIFETNGNTIILFYTGEGEQYSSVVVTAVLANEHIDEISEAAVAACNFDEKTAMTANVGVYLGN